MSNRKNEIEKILNNAEESIEAEIDTVDAADEIDKAALLDELGGKKPKKAKKEKKRRTAGAKRRLQYRAGFTATIIVAVVAVILFNVVVSIIAKNYPIAWDISSNKTYTLSDQSIEIAKQVQQDTNIIIFGEEDNLLANDTNYLNLYYYYGYEITELETIYRSFTSALEQYKMQSGGKVTYTYINPTQEPQKYAAYQKYDVAAGDILFICGERYKSCSLTDLYNLDTSYLTVESNVEKLLASNIYSLTNGKEVIVQVLTGKNEDNNVIEGLRTLYELNGYSFKELKITGSEEFNKDASVMLIAAPTEDYNPEEIKRVQEWVYNEGSYGRQLMVFVSPTANCPNLYEFLEVEYQITVTDEQIEETDLSRLKKMHGKYLVADVASAEYTANSSGTANVYTPFVRRLTTTLPSALENDTIGSYAIPLLEYPNSTKLSKLEDLESLNSTESTDSYAAAEGDYPLTGMIVHAIDSYNNETQTAVDGRVLVSGCSYMAYSSLVQDSTLQNEELLLDVLNTMTGIENAITISSKTIETKYASFTSAEQLIFGLGIFTVGLPLAVLIICLVVFVRRKNL